MKYLGQPQAGSLANQVASRNPFGQYFRDRVTPTDPATAFQIATRSTFATAVAQWGTFPMTDERRAMWSHWAEHEFSQGMLVREGKMTGQLAFVRAWLTRTALGISPEYEPPAQQQGISLGGCELTLSLGAASADWTAAAGRFVGLYCTPPTSAGRAFSSAARPRLLTGTNSAPPFDLTALYVARFGGLPLSGQAVFLGVRELQAVVLSPMVISRSVMP